MANDHRGIGWTEERGLATIRLAGDHGNAIGEGFVDALERVLREIEATASARGALLASAAKIFSPGLDLRVLSRYDRSTLDRFMERFTGGLIALYTFPKPLVAAVSGHAIAGGCVLALTADRRILRRGALIGLNEIRVGLPLPLAVAELVRASVEPAYLEEVALVGRNYTDEEAVAAGLVHEVLDAERFEERCFERLEEFASKDAAAFSTTKRYLRAEAAERMKKESAARRAEFLDAWFSDSTRARIAAIVADLESRSK